MSDLPSRFEPEPDKPYATCECGETFAEREPMSIHLIATKHSARITNPSRPERIEREMDSLVDSAINEFIDDAWSLLDRHEDLTRAELLAGLRFWGDFADALKEAFDEEPEDSR